MGRLTYFYLQTALFFAAGIVFYDYFQQPLSAAAFISVGIVMSLVGAGEANSGRHR